MPGERGQIERGRIGVRSSPRHHEGLFVGRSEVGDQTLRHIARQPQLRRLVYARGENEVVGGKGRAVVIGETLTETIACLHSPIGEHPRSVGVELRKRFREHWLGLAGIVKERQLRVESTLRQLDARTRRAQWFARNAWRLETSGHPPGTRQHKLWLLRLGRWSATR